MYEFQRSNRERYSSGRKEAFGIEPGMGFGKSTRFPKRRKQQPISHLDKDIDFKKSPIDRLPLKSNFRWKI